MTGKLRGVRRWGDRFAGVLLPPACAGCGRYLPAGSADSDARPRICPECCTRLKALPHPRCSRCHAPRPTGRKGGGCLECLEWPKALSSGRSAVVLAPPADRLVYALKYGGWPELAEPMADRMVRACFPISGMSDDAPVVPVPTTPRRVRARGYNQARVLAEALARRTGRPLMDTLRRRGEGRSQISLQPGERRANVESVFTLEDRDGNGLRGRDVLLVDDVLTTGATVAAAAHALGEGGARSVVSLTFARALPDPLR